MAVRLSSECGSGKGSHFGVFLLTGCPGLQPLPGARVPDPGRESGVPVPCGLQRRRLLLLLFPAERGLYCGEQSRLPFCLCLGVLRLPKCPWDVKGRNGWPAVAQTFYLAVTSGVTVPPVTAAESISLLSLFFYFLSFLL